MKKRANIELVVAAVILIVLTLYAVSAVTLRPPFIDGIPSPSFWPLLLAGIGYPPCLVILARALREESPVQGRVSSRNAIIATIGLTGLYAVIFSPVGYWISTILYCFGLSMVFSTEQRRSTVKRVIFSMIVAIGLTAIGYAMYKLLFNIRLPGGQW